MKRQDVPVDVALYRQPSTAVGRVVPGRPGVLPSSGPRRPDGSPAPTGRAVPTLPPFWLEKPPGGVDYYQRNTDTLAAVAGAVVLFPPIRLPDASDRLQVTFRAELRAWFGRRVKNCKSQIQ